MAKPRNINRREREIVGRKERKEKDEMEYARSSEKRNKEA